MYDRKEHDKMSAEFNKKAKLLKNKKLKSLSNLEYVWHNKLQGRYLADAVFAANDGIITTFAVVAGVAGADLSPLVVIILGVANMLADGASMGLGNFLGKKSELSYRESQRKKEEWEIDHIPEVEISEIREIFKKKGFAGEDLDRAVEIITSNREVWLDTMMKEELGICDEADSSPAKHGAVTFLSFLIAGLFPLLPYFFFSYPTNVFQLSIFTTAVILFILGSLRSKFMSKNFLASGMEMLLIGGIAAVIAYLTGFLLAGLIS